MIRLSKRVAGVVGCVVRRAAEREGGQAGLPAKTSSLVKGQTETIPKQTDMLACVRARDR
jgi:hypothetical protein